MAPQPPPRLPRSRCARGCCELLVVVSTSRTDPQNLPGLERLLPTPTPPKELFWGGFHDTSNENGGEAGDGAGERGATLSILLAFGNNGANLPLRCQRCNFPPAKHTGGRFWNSFLAVSKYYRDVFQLITATTLPSQDPPAPRNAALFSSPSTSTKN